MHSTLRIPAVLPHLHAQLESLSLAVGYLENYHYDAAVSDFAHAASPLPAVELGHAAMDLLVGQRSAGGVVAGATMLALAGADGVLAGAEFAAAGWWFRYESCGLPCRRSVWQEAVDDATLAAAPWWAEEGEALFWQAPVWGGVSWFARLGLGDEDAHLSAYQQAGLAWETALPDGIRFHAGYSQIREEGSFLGAEQSGAFVVEGSDSRQYNLLFATPLGEHWSGVVHYEGGAVRLAANSVLQSTSMRFGGWGGSFVGRSLFRGGDKLLLSYNRQTSVSSGKLPMQLSAAGDAVFIEDLRYRLNSGYESYDAALELSGEGWDVYAVGYGAVLGGGVEVALAVEHQRRLDERGSAVSGQLLWRF